MSDSVHDCTPEAIPELEQLGKALRDARQQKGLSLSDLADRLHIGINQLHALETGDRSKLREPVFVVAQAKRVAGTLGVDIHQQLEDLRGSDLMRTPPRPHPKLAAPVHSEPGLSRSSRSAGSSSKGGGFGPVALISALVVGVVALGVALLMRPGGGDGPTADSTVPSSPAPAPSPVDQTKEGGSASEPEVGAEGNEAAEPNPDDVLLLQASGASWLTVRDAGGAILFEGTLEGEQRFPLGEGLEVRAGRPDLVRASIGAQPAKVLGTIEEIRWTSFKPAP